MNNMITTHEIEKYDRSHNWTHMVYTTSFSRKSVEKALVDASAWMKEYSETFIEFVYQSGAFCCGQYVAAFTSPYANTKRTYGDATCTVTKSESGKTWAVNLRSTGNYRR